MLTKPSSRHFGQQSLLVSQHLRIAGEIGVDEFAGLIAGDLQPLGQAERALAVNQAEVDRLGHAPLTGRDLAFGNLEDLGGHPGVNVAILGEGLPQFLIAAEVGQQPQFDLRIIGREQLPARLPAETPGECSRPVRCGWECSAGSDRWS